MSFFAACCLLLSARHDVTHHELALRDIMLAYERATFLRYFAAIRHAAAIRYAASHVVIVLRAEAPLSLPCLRQLLRYHARL